VLLCSHGEKESEETSTQAFQKEACTEAGVNQLAAQIVRRIERS
jgi:hypothetical protein